MGHWKGRLLGLFLIVLFAGLIYLGWHELRTEGRYSLKMAALSPLGVVGGLFLLLFPSKAGKPETTADKVVVMLVLVSSELPEVLGLSDRVLVLHEGRVTGEFKRAEATPEAVMACATGHTKAVTGDG